MRDINPQNAMQAYDRYDMAEALRISSALRALITHPRCLYIEILALCELGRVDEARRLFKRKQHVLEAVTDAPGMIWHVRGRLALHEGNTQSAILLRHALALGEENVQSLRGLAESYRRLKWHRREIHYLKRALAVAPSQLELDLLRAIDLAYIAIGDMPKSLQYRARLRTLAPNNHNWPLYMAADYAFIREFDRSLALYAEAEALDTQKQILGFELAFIHLARGEWNDAWPLYETRMLSSEYKNNGGKPIDIHSPVWDGAASLTGKTVLAIAEQGAGDHVQFARYAEQLKHLGARVLVKSMAAMAPLLATLPWADEIVVDNTPIPPHDYHIRLMSMPLLARTTPDTIPLAPAPYLSAPTPRPRFSKKFTVGLAWKGNLLHPRDPWRSMPTRSLHALIRAFPEVQFVSLQMPPHDRVLQRYLANGLLIDGMQGVTNYVDTAAVLAAVDLVIAVDTATAHIAGAMHKPVWVLLSYFYDWRWVGAEEKTRWYPTMRLFRQKKVHGWRELIARVSDSLRATLDQTGSTANTSGM